MRRDPLLTALGVPELHTAEQLERLCGLSRGSLSPALLRRSGTLRAALATAADILQGRPVRVTETAVLARAGMLVERLDEGAVYSLPELGARMKLWGMETADDWLVRLHQAGAPAVFVERGWCGVRHWAREVVR